MLIETYNALFLVRVFTKQFAGNLTNRELMDKFEGEDGLSKGEELVRSLLSILMNMDPK